MKNYIYIFITCSLLIANLTVKGQADLKNTGMLYITSATDTMFISGSLTNSSAGELVNSGKLYVKQNLINDEIGMAAGSGTLLLNGSSLQTVSGSRKFKTYNLFTDNSAGIALNQDFLIKNDISLVSGNLNINNNQLQLGGNITDAGQINAATGTVEMNGNTAQIIPANTFENHRLKNLVISNNVSLAGQDTLTGTLAFGGNNKTLATGGLLILKSNATGTARIADLTNAGTNSGNAITGNITIERYIPSRKAWHLLSAPLSTIGAPTISAAWQEGLTTSSSNPNLYPGYGVHITGGTVLNGFDQSLTNNASLKIYNSLTNTFIGLPPIPGTNSPISLYAGYMVYVRGDRSINLMQGASAAVTSTTLRMKGDIKTYDQISAVTPLGFTVAGNPYPSAIDFETLTKNNVKNTMYLWDPQLSGSYGLGAYVTVSWNAATSSYDITSAAGPITQYIPSGEAFIVSSLNNITAGTLTIKESDKTSNGGGVARPQGIDQKVRIGFYSRNTDSTVSLLDGVLTTYDDINMNQIDQDDAVKINSSNENIAIMREAKNISIERRKLVTVNDTTFLKLSQVRYQGYQLEIITENMAASGLTGFVKDSYSSANNDMPLNMEGITNVPFTINTDAGSYAANRFSIVFRPAAPVPVSFTSVKANRQQEDIAVKWTVENQSAIKEYHVEQSANGSIFTHAATLAATGNNGASAVYSWLDKNVAAGDHYYRIRSAGLDGRSGYSAIVKVAIEESKDDMMVISPNPVKGNTVSLNLKGLEKGIYQLELYNTQAQLVKKMSLQHSGAESYSFSIDDHLPAGTYQLKLTGNSVQIIKALIKK